MREGYARGWGLQFGDLKSKIARGPLYRDALALAVGGTLQQEVNRMNLFLPLKFFVGQLPTGYIAEFGSYRGGSAIFMTQVCQVFHPEMQVFPFDTFEGMPVTDSRIDAHREGDLQT